MLAERTRKKLRWVVIRPRNQSLVESALNQAGEAIRTRQYDAFSEALNDALRDGGIYVGCLKPGCRTLFNFDGSPGGGFTLQPGDVFDDIEDFRTRYGSGAYQVTGERFDPDGTVHKSPVTSHEEFS